MNFIKLTRIGSASDIFVNPKYIVSYHEIVHIPNGYFVSIVHGLAFETTDNVPEILQKHHFKQLLKEES